MLPNDFVRLSCFVPSSNVPIIHKETRIKHPYLKIYNVVILLLNHLNLTKLGIRKKKS